jgi:hypothetical protein
MALKPLNRKAELLTAMPGDDVRPYSVGDCCPGFAPGWEVGSSGNADPCPWQNDLPACHPCFWSAQVPDSTAYPGWLSACANLSQDWTNLCTVPD